MSPRKAPLLNPVDALRHVVAARSAEPAGSGALATPRRSSDPGRSRMVALCTLKPAGCFCSGIRSAKKKAGFSQLSSGAGVSFPSPRTSKPNQQSTESTATTMKSLTSYALTLTIILAAPGMALAGEKEGGKKPGWTVTAVDTAANTITVHSGKKNEPGEDKIYKVADATITVEGSSAKLADITVGMRAKITAGASPDTASAVEASTKKKKGEGKKKGDGAGSQE